MDHKGVALYQANDANVRIAGILVGKENSLTYETFTPPENEISCPEPYMLQHPVHLLIIHYTVIRRIHASSEDKNHEYCHEDPGSSEKINPGK
jgi:hypothetical protein